MKRKLTLFLSAVMAASCLPMTAYAANFKDISDVPWAATVINNVADRGLLSGYEDNTFRGKNNVTYCEAMQMAYTTLTKSGAVEPIDAVTAYSYMGVLDTYKVPKWSQMAVAYGLSEGIIDMQMVVSKFAGGKTAATREDVAIIFGNAMAPLFGKERDTTAAKTFVDYWSISVNALEQVDILKRLGIIGGDNYGRFNPKNNITRAEMAVILSNTYDKVADGVAEKGELIEVVKNGDNYYFRMERENGGTEGFHATEGTIPVYVGYTTEKVSMSKLIEGDEVEFVFSGTELIAIRQLGTKGVQGKYEVTGYINSLKDDKLSIENENTGETDKYTIRNGADITVDGEEVSLSKLRDILAERYDEHAYAGLTTKTERERVASGNYVDRTYIDKLDVTFVNEYTVVGEVKTFGNSSITVKQADGGAERAILYADGVEYYIADEKATYSELRTLYQNGTTYAKVTVNDDDKATKIIMSEDTFANTNAVTESRTYDVSSISDKRIILKDSGEKYTYDFGTKNPLANITFYLWDDLEDDWDEEDDIAKVVKYVDVDNAEKDCYAKITFNSGDKLSEVYIANEKTAWRDSAEHQTDRKGTVASIEDGVLKFKTSSIEYKLLNKYESGKLLVNGALANTKTVLTRLANDSSIELYAEIVANGDNEAIEIKARPTKAVGALVFWDRDQENDKGRYIEIETEDGNKIQLKTQKSPKLTDEVENEFELEDIQGSRYIGETIELGFNSSGIVDTFTIVDGYKAPNVTVKVKGIATGAYDGLEVDGKTYPWLSKTANISVHNYSCPQTSLDVVKDLIEDPDVKVYVEATLDDKGRVETIRAYVQEAEGELTEYKDKGNVRILTDSGNRFSFIPNNKLDKCDVNNWDQEDLQIFGRGIGYGVLLTFDKDGDVSSIEDR